jgi:hypothetical protein
MPSQPLMRKIELKRIDVMGKWAMVIATVGGMGLAMLFAGRIGYWIERKVQAWQLRRKKEGKDNL